MRRFLVALLALSIVPSTGSAQDDGFLVTFHFDTLSFAFHASGLPSTRMDGSGIAVQALNVKIEGEEVKDLRHCIDGWGYPECSYGDALGAYYQSNKDGQVTSDEVTKFEGFATIGASLIEKMKRLQASLQNNITVDGLKGGTPRVTELDFREAEGPVSGTAPAFADVSVEVGYGNDKSAKRHEIHVKSIDLASEGFVYATAKWTLGGDGKWEYDASETLPESAKGRVTKTGWTSSQQEFESSSDDTLRLVVEQPAKKKTPGPPVALLLVGVVGAVLLLRRR